MTQSHIADSDVYWPMCNPSLLFKHQNQMGLPFFSMYLRRQTLESSLTTLMKKESTGDHQSIRFKIMHSKVLHFNIFRFVNSPLINLVKLQLEKLLEQHFHTTKTQVKSLLHILLEQESCSKYLDL